MRLILKNIYFLSLFLFLVSCNNKEDDSISLNSLIVPEYTYTQDFFYCDLDESSSLINLESFLSSLVAKYQKELSIFNNIDILFPEAQQEVSRFIFSIRSSNNLDALKRFIEILETEGLSSISTCIFLTDQSSGLDMNNSIKSNTRDFINVEILRCKYNADYNYGTFRIATDRFISSVGRLKMPYSFSYINSSQADTDFLWINSFPINDYKEFLEKNWIKDEESKAIKDEFNENATCLDSKKYKSYSLI